MANVNIHWEMSNQTLDVGLPTTEVPDELYSIVYQLIPGQTGTNSNSLVTITNNLGTTHSPIRGSVETAESNQTQTRFQASRRHKFFTRLSQKLLKRKKSYPTHCVKVFGVPINRKHHLALAPAYMFSSFEVLARSLALFI